MLPPMLKSMPTKRGDVLILATTQNSYNYAVATVHEDGQQDFGPEFNGRYVASLEVALTQAKAFVMPRGQIYLVNIETGDWVAMSIGTDEKSKSAGW